MFVSCEASGQLTAVQKAIKSLDSPLLKEIEVLECGPNDISAAQVVIETLLVWLLSPIYKVILADPPLLAPVVDTATQLAWAQECL